MFSLKRVFSDFSAVSCSAFAAAFLAVCVPETAWWSILGRAFALPSGGADVVGTLHQSYKKRPRFAASPCENITALRLLLAQASVYL